MEINQIVAIGNIIGSRPVDDNLNELLLEVERLSGRTDTIRVLSPDDAKGKVKVYGQVRSRHDEGLKLYVYSELMEKTSLDDDNEAIIEGYVCKEPYFKEVCNRLITSFMLVYNGRRNHYVPVVTWGKTALLAKGLKLGDKVVVTGRFQERTYVKDGLERSVNELSARNLVFVPQELTDAVI